MFHRIQSIIPNVDKIIFWKTAGLSVAAAPRVNQYIVGANRINAEVNTLSRAFPIYGGICRSTFMLWYAVPSLYQDGSQDHMSS